MATVLADIGSAWRNHRVPVWDNDPAGANVHSQAVGGTTRHYVQFHFEADGAVGLPDTWTHRLLLVKAVFGPLINENKGIVMAELAGRMVLAIHKTQAWATQYVIPAGVAKRLVVAEALLRALFVKCMAVPPEGTPFLTVADSQNWHSHPAINVGILEASEMSGADPVIQCWENTLRESAAARLAQAVAMTAQHTGAGPMEVAQYVLGTIQHATGFDPGNFESGDTATAFTVAEFLGTLIRAAVMRVARTTDAVPEFIFASGMDAALSATPALRAYLVQYTPPAINPAVAHPVSDPYGVLRMCAATAMWVKQQTLLAPLWQSLVGAYGETALGEPDYHTAEGFLTCISRHRSTDETRRTKSYTLRFLYGVSDTASLGRAITDEAGHCLAQAKAAADATAAAAAATAAATGAPSPTAMVVQNMMAALGDQPHWDFAGRRSLGSPPTADDAPREIARTIAFAPMIPRIGAAPRTPAADDTGRVTPTGGPLYTLPTSGRSGGHGRGGGGGGARDRGVGLAGQADANNGPDGGSDEVHEPNGRRHGGDGQGAHGR